MTADLTPAPDLGWLDELERLRAAATPGEWAQHPSDDEYVIGDVSDDGMSYADVGDTYAFRKREGSADAALIVAAVNNLPRLTAAVRAVLELHRPFVDSYGIERLWCQHDPDDSWPCPTVKAITAAMASERTTP